MKIVRMYVCDFNANLFEKKDFFYVEKLDLGWNEMKSALRMRIFVFIYIHSCGFLLLKIYDNFFNLEQNKRRQLDEIDWIC